MFKSKSVLAIIGARSGSKGLKNKNILTFNGKPLIAWTIKAANASKYIDRVIVSTDAESIASVARKHGADVPFLRPQRLAKDDSLIEDVIRHAIVWMRDHEKRQYEYVLLLQPTSPLRKTEHIDEAIEWYFRNKTTMFDTLVSVIKAPAKVGWVMKSNQNGYVQFCFDIKGQKVRRQDIPTYYFPNGMIYFAPVKVIRKKSFYTSRTIPFEMDADISVDIDIQDDFDRALKMVKFKKK